MKHLTLAFLLAVLMLTSCSSLIRYQMIIPKVEIGEVQRIVDKSYELNEIKTSFVGDEIIRVKDYYISKAKDTKVKSLDDFVISGGNVNGTGLKVTLQGYANESYDIKGLINYNNQDVYVVQIPDINGYNSNYYPLISQSGEFLNKVIAAGFVQPGKLSIVPNATIFNKVITEKTDYTKGYLSQELIYSGRNKNEIKIAYREYTEDGLAKPAFYQDLTYQLKDSIIRFKKIKLEILKASNEQIEFKVIEDGID